MWIRPRREAGCRPVSSGSSREGEWEPGGSVFTPAPHLSRPVGSSRQAGQKRPGSVRPTGLRWHPEVRAARVAQPCRVSAGLGGNEREAGSPQEPNPSFGSSRAQSCRTCRRCRSSGRECGRLPARRRVRLGLLRGPAAQCPLEAWGGPHPGSPARSESLSLPPVPEVLQLSDALRDDVLPELGVRLEDHEGGCCSAAAGACSRRLPP